MSRVEPDKLVGWPFEFELGVELAFRLPLAASEPPSLLLVVVLALVVVATAADAVEGCALLVLGVCKPAVELGVAASDEVVVEAIAIVVVELGVLAAAEQDLLPLMPLLSVVWLLVGVALGW